MDFNLFDYLTEKKGAIAFNEVGTIYVKKGIILYQPPQRNTPIYEIVQGAIRIGTYSPIGEEVCYDILKTGDFLATSNTSTANLLNLPSP